MRAATVLLGVMLMLGTTGGPANASAVIATFNPAHGEFPEGIASDIDGNLYVSFAVTGEIRRIGRDGSQSTYHRFDPGTAGLGVLGLAADRSGTIYAAVSSNAPTAHGVWAITGEGVATRLAGSEAIAFPNGLARGPSGEQIDVKAQMASL